MVKVLSIALLFERRIGIGNALYGGY